jgi:invasion protein IalB
LSLFEFYCSIKMVNSRGVEMKKLSLPIFATAAIMCAGSAFADPATVAILAPAAAPVPAVTQAPAANAAPAAPVATAQATPDENEVVCETQSPPTGSLIGGIRVCRTRHQWKAQESQTQIGQDLHRMSMGAGPSGNN